MQLLVDTIQETPASLRFIAATLCALADTYGPPVAEHPDTTQPSINGPAGVVTLIEGLGLNADRSIDPVPAAVWAGSPDAVFARSDVYKGVIHENVPAGTTFPPPSGMSTAPPAPANSMASAPPVPTTIPPSALPAMTIAAGISVAPDAGVSSPVSEGAPAAPAPNAERDKDGLPWDARIHSETHKTNAGGTWRYRRNLDPAVKAWVMAELRAAYPRQLGLTVTAPPIDMPATTEQISITLGVAPPPPSVTLPQPGPGLLQPAAPLPVPAGVSVGMPNAPQPPSVPAAPVTGFRDFMSKINKAIAAGKLKQEQVTNACRAIGLDSITALAGEPMKIPLVDAQINQLLGA